MPDPELRPDFPVYRYCVSAKSGHDPHSSAILSDLHALGLAAITAVRCSHLYFIQTTSAEPLSAQQLDLCCTRLLADGIVEEITFSRLPETIVDDTRLAVEVAYRVGVTDTVAEALVHAAHVLGISQVAHAASGWRYVFEGDALSESVVHQAAQRLLANPTVQRYSLSPIEPHFPASQAASQNVETFPLRSMTDAELLALSQTRRAALDLAEMQAIQAYCRLEERDLTDIEFEMIAQTWSEHCVHKTFKARIDVTEADGSRTVLDNVMRTCLKAATDQINASWVLSAFKDNAGIIEFDGVHELSFKVETHNHPSAIEPFGGANTGVGGVIRDVLGVSAKPIANTDVLCFGLQDMPFDALPAGVLHPRRILSGVVAGVQDYGNKIGIPTVNGAILYDAGFAANPLVFCGCLGIAPKNSHPRQPNPNDRVIVLGGRTGRDGLRGATFSSMTMDAQTGEVSGASVQIGNPITEKGLIEVVTRARDARLYTAITDCGAGGLSSAVGEMSAELGALIDLDAVKLKYAGLAPWEIWLSEAQERMVLAVPPQNLPALQAICDTFEVDLTDIGSFSGNGRLLIRSGGNTVLNLSMPFLHEGIPQRQLKAKIEAPTFESLAAPLDASHLEADLLGLLSHPNIASKEHVIRLYDHEVQGNTVIKPLMGVQHDAPSDACVLKPWMGEGDVALAMGAGINPEYGKQDAGLMTWSVIDEAVRNIVAVGADPARIAILDNFCWGDPLRAETLGSLVLAARACHDAALHYGTPFISGKDSFNNEYLGTDGQRHAIPPTLLISSLGIMDKWQNAISMDLKEAGNLLFLIGEFHPKLGGSHYALTRRQPIPETCPIPSKLAPQVYQVYHQAIKAGLVRACHDLSEGGLAVALAEMCIGGRCGLAVQFGAGMAADAVRSLFGETNGCLLVEVTPEDATEFALLFEKLPIMALGRVTVELVLCITAEKDKPLLKLAVEALARAWQTIP